MKQLTPGKVNNDDDEGGVLVLMGSIIG